MLRLAADENFDHDIVRGLRRRSPGLDILTVQEAGLGSSDDPTVLAWAAEEGRVLLTHDASTITRFAYDRVVAGQSMPGVFQVGTWLAVGQVVEEMLLIVQASREGEWEGQVRYLPL